MRLWPWLPVAQLQVDLAFQVDQLSAVMLLVVTGVGSLIHLFSIGYMKEDPGYARYFAYLNLFIVFMLVLVLGSSFPVMFIGWEGVGLCSYLLIGFWFNDKANADAGQKAFIVNRIGDFGFLVAMFFVWRAFGTLTSGTSSRGPRRCSRRAAPSSPPSRCCSSLAAPASRPRSRSTPGSPTRWLARRRFRAHPCRHDGHRRRVPRRAHQRALRHGAGLEHRGGRHRRADRSLRRHDRPAAVRHQEGAGLFDRLPAWLHVPRRGHRRLRRRGSSTWPRTPFSRRCSSSARAASSTPCTRRTTLPIRMRMRRTCGTWAGSRSTCRSRSG